MSFLVLSFSLKLAYSMLVVSLILILGVLSISQGLKKTNILHFNVKNVKAISSIVISCLLLQFQSISRLAVKHSHFNIHL